MTNKLSIKFFIRKIIWGVLDIVLAFLPITIYVICNSKKYFEVINNTSKFNNIASLVMLGIFLVVLIAKKEWLKGVLGMWIIVGLFYALRYIASDSFQISLYIALGYTLSQWITHPLMIRYDRLYKQSESAEITNVIQQNNFDKIVKAINGNG